MAKDKGSKGEKPTNVGDFHKTTRSWTARATGRRSRRARWKRRSVSGRTTSTARTTDVAKSKTPCDPVCTGPWDPTGNRTYPMKRCRKCGAES